jgi:hypothetical protein
MRHEDELVVMANRVKYLLCHPSLCFCEENPYSYEIGELLTEIRAELPAHQFESWVAEKTLLHSIWTEFFMVRYSRLSGIARPAPKLIYERQEDSKQEETVLSKQKETVLSARQNGTPPLDWLKRRSVNEAMAEQLSDKLRLCTCDGATAGLGMA